MPARLLAAATRWLHCEAAHHLAESKERYVDGPRLQLSQRVAAHLLVQHRGAAGAGERGDSLGRIRRAREVDKRQLAARRELLVVLACRRRGSLAWGADAHSKHGMTAVRPAGDWRLAGDGRRTRSHSDVPLLLSVAHGLDQLRRRALRLSLIHI